MKEKLGTIFGWLVLIVSGALWGFLAACALVVWMD